MTRDLKGRNVNKNVWTYQWFRSWIQLVWMRLSRLSLFIVFSYGCDTVCLLAKLITQCERNTRCELSVNAFVHYQCSAIAGGLRWSWRTSVKQNRLCIDVAEVCEKTDCDWPHSICFCQKTTDWEGCLLIFSLSPLLNQIQSPKGWQLLLLMHFASSLLSRSRSTNFWTYFHYKIWIENQI